MVSMVGKEKQIRALETLVDTKYEKCIALPLTIHIRKKMPGCDSRKL